jgi:hypothetical protein
VICDSAIFVGGSIIGLLVSDHAIRDVRATDDVDIVIEVASYAKYAVIETMERVTEELRKKGNW